MSIPNSPQPAQRFPSPNRHTRPAQQRQALLGACLLPFLAWLIFDNEDRGDVPSNYMVLKPRRSYSSKQPVISVLKVTVSFFFFYKFRQWHHVDATDPANT